jgi:hypothetical protein
MTSFVETCSSTWQTCELGTVVLKSDVKWCQGISASSYTPRKVKKKRNLLLPHYRFKIIFTLSRQKQNIEDYIVVCFLL